MKIKIFTLLFIGLMISCSSTNNSLLVGESYDESNKQTTLTIVPYGNLNIPGKWRKTSYNEISRQHFFINDDSTSIAITKNPKEKYPFNSDTYSNTEFSEQFFNWEKEFYENKGFKIEKVESGNGYVIWNANKNNDNTIFLYGAKNNFAYNYAIFTTYWNEVERIAFLKSLFEKN